MKSRVWMGGVFALIPMVVFQASAGWYAGAEAGYVEHTFKAHYDYIQGGTPDDFTDLAYGVGGDIVGGYRFLLCDTLALSAQGRVSMDNAEWTLTTDEPADLTYTLPFAYSVSLLPDITLFKRFELFGEIGIGQGYIHQKKTSPSASRYDAREWIPAYSFGGGLRYRFTDNWQVFVQYRYTTYGNISYDSHLPDGTHWESIESKTATDFYTIGLAYRFGA